ncbi:hypothetical protein [Nakamurella lactea]|uniref:hypothetical protein n=1 Tax=Nakamurella lactea TaxID=459515 RepID=UPI0004281755|nr:hypothetical protein [Nakamurella lactea]
MSARQPAPENAWYRLLALPILIALATGIGPYATGAPLSRSIGIGLTLGVVSLFVLMSMSSPRAEWPEPPMESPEWGRLPKRWEVPGLDAALERPQFMSRRVLVQLARLAGELLSRRGLTLDSPGARELLGDRTIALLTDPEAKAPSRAELSSVIGVLTRLAADPAAAPLPIPPGLVAAPRRRRLLPIRGVGRNLPTTAEPAPAGTPADQPTNAVPQREDTR